MSASARRSARFARPSRRMVARGSALGLGLLVVAGTSPAAAVVPLTDGTDSPVVDPTDTDRATTARPLNVAPDKDKPTNGNQAPGTNNGNQNPGTSQGNDSPGGNTPGNNTPGTNDA